MISNDTLTEEGLRILENLGIEPRAEGLVDEDESSKLCEKSATVKFDIWRWFWRGQRDRTVKSTSMQYLKGLEKQHVVKSLEEFNDEYPSMTKPSKMNRGDMYVFRKGAEPAWENFPGGGCWVLNLTERGARHANRDFPQGCRFLDFNIVDGVWEEIIGATINERFGTRDLAGVVMSVRRSNMYYKLMIWNRNSVPGAKEHIRKRLIEILCLPEDCGLTYKYFFDSLRNCRAKKPSRGKKKDLYTPRLGREGEGQRLLRRDMRLTYVPKIRRTVSTPQPTTLSNTEFPPLPVQVRRSKSVPLYEQ